MSTLCLDFDGVLHSYTSGWEGIDIITDPPVPGALEFVLEAVEAFDSVAIYSARSRDTRGIRAMKTWLYLWEFPVHSLDFPTTKPIAIVMLDDRAIQFTGEFPDVTELRSFKTWMGL